MLNSSTVDKRHCRQQRLHQSPPFGRPCGPDHRHARAGNIRIDISDPILNDTLRDKFEWNGYKIHDARFKLLSISNHVSPAGNLSVIKEDPDDDCILECATAAKSDFIVSEDKDLLRLGRYENVRILPTREFVYLLQRLGKVR